MHRSSRLLTASLLVLVLSLTGCGALVPDPRESALLSKGNRLAKALEVLDRKDVPVVVSVSLGGKPATVREFGALASDGVSPEETLVDIGSITKTVTGVAVSKLVEQGKVGLDETLSDVFPGVPADKAGITVEQLLTHSSGLVESVGDDFEQLDRDEFLARAFDSRLLQKPGSRYAYSNVGYSILAAIIEVRSGLSYEKYLSDRVLAPAGLGGIGYLSSYDAKRALRSTTGESILDASWGGHDASWHLIGNGGLVTTATTVVEFLHALTSGKLLADSSLARLQKAHIAEDESAESFYGYGLVVQDVPKLGRIYWHDGGNDVFSAEWSLYADHGDIIFVAGADPEGGADESVASAAAGVLREHLYATP
ncbi:serine hydrolase domain-containing protein [Microbacterium sp. PMB16]|uniref:serine hydrolase domain-containing protein n=1 Tax=Microbacterium sp. PMB16 TaxID=3120157 RepID=UPI003F4AFF66